MINDVVVMVCARPVDAMFVIPTPTSVSRKYLSTDSLVMLFLTSLMTTSPIRDGEAKHLDGAGSPTGLSLLVCGKSSLTG